MATPSFAPLSRRCHSRITETGLQGYFAHIRVSEVPLYLSVTRSLSLVQWCAERKLCYAYYDTLPANIKHPKPDTRHPEA